MGILAKSEITKRIKEDRLIINEHNVNGEPVVEPASYDLRVGIIIWKEVENNRPTIKRRDFNPLLSIDKQDMVTIQPGQVIFVITQEQVNMPLDLCGTVYAKNEFSRCGILLFTTGHIDPGIQCPIVIRLVNLRSTPFALTLGHPIYTIVFHTIKPFVGGVLERHENITIEKTIQRTIKSAEDALDNTLYDLSLLNHLIRKDEFGKAAWSWIKSQGLKIFLIVVGVITFLATIIGAIPSAIESWSKWRASSNKTIEQSTKQGKSQSATTIKDSSDENYIK
ncbi:MAG: deoxycytidine triphosphate deaminase [Segetibacter sp.]|nr:deoxycytidine triphosphate deaminase [Segetibacter sp.]